MKRRHHIGVLTMLFLLPIAGIFGAPAFAQGPVTVPLIIANAAAPIVVPSRKPKLTGLVKFEGLVMNANIAQITMRSRTDELSIQTFSLSQEASVKMQQVVDKGGYQYGDKVTVYYDPSTKQVVKFKGKPSKPI